MTKEKFLYGLNACAVTYHNGQKFYEHDELVKCFEDLEIFEQEPCDKCVYSTKDGYCQYDDITETIPPFEPCEDAISRQAVLDIVNNPLNIRLDEIIKKLPPVTPQPKTGHWIAHDIYNCHTDFKCSECGYIHNFMHLYGEPKADYTHCPNCGAKMAESEDKKE